jgi:hypothetical protein
MIYSDPASLQPVIDSLRQVASRPRQGSLSGLCGFDGFIDSFIRMESPASMAEFGPKVTAAAGIAASYMVQRQGDKFGGNGPLFASALRGILGAELNLTYAGALGRDAILPIFQEALEGSVDQIYTLADPAHSDCLEFTDGKVMLCDLRSCAEITWERLLECVGEEALDGILTRADFISAVNWGKLVNVGPLWKNLAERHRQLGKAPRELSFFMDLAEFEQRPEEDRQGLINLAGEITKQCRTLLSFNLKEAWQMGETLGGNFSGKKAPDDVAALAVFLRERIDVDRIIIHPNDGAACASEDKVAYVPGPFCSDPLISTGAGDNFGAGCLAGALQGLDDAGIVLAGNCASGYFVRTGRSASFSDMVGLIDQWVAGTLSDRL